MIHRAQVFLGQDWTDFVIEGVQIRGDLLNTTFVMFLQPFLRRVVFL